MISCCEHFNHTVTADDFLVEIIADLSIFARRLLNSNEYQ
jgi:hypothetical protein